MRLILTPEQRSELFNIIGDAEACALNGSRSQVWMDTRNNKFWITHFGFHEGYGDDPEKDNYLELWSTEPHTLKDIYQDEKEYEDYKWIEDGDPVGYMQRVELENRHLSGCSDAFDIDTIIEDIADKFDIYIEDENDAFYEKELEIGNLVFGIAEAFKKKKEGTLTRDDIIQVHAMQDKLKDIAKKAGMDVDD